MLLVNSDAEDEIKSYLDEGFSQGMEVTRQMVSKVRHLLQDACPTFATSPRLYIALYKAALLSSRNSFLSRSLSDANLPFAASNLPSDLPTTARSAFLRSQALVLTQPAELSSCESGQHVYATEQSQLPFRKVGTLGSGNNSQVDVVESSVTKRRYARKLVRRQAFGRFQSDLAMYLNELKVLQRIRHRHMVNIVGSYTDPAHAALLMSPVADCDLSQYLRHLSQSRNKESIGSLRTFFGCLAVALKYLHRLRIRHKDIKPSNILIHAGEVLFVDFGLSRDCDDTRSTTEGPSGRTPKYASPEVMDAAPRSFSSDLWSLGCVFLEMFTVLKGFTASRLAEHMLNNGAGTTAYHSNEDAVADWINILRAQNNEEPDNAPLFWIQDMMQQDRQLRPSASLVATHIVSHRSESDRAGEFCGLCCRYEDDDLAEENVILLSQVENIDLEQIEPSIETTHGPLQHADSGLGPDIETMNEAIHEIPERKQSPGLFVSDSEDEDSDAEMLELYNTPESEAVLPIQQPNYVNNPRADARNAVGEDDVAAAEDSEMTIDIPRARNVFRRPSGDYKTQIPFNSRFFSLRCNAEVNIETSVAHGIWTCHPSINSKLDNAFRAEPHRRIFLLFSIVGAGKYCGVAEMMSSVDKTYEPEHWIGDGWTGEFEVEWRSTQEILYADVSHLPCKEGSTHSVNRVTTGMEIWSVTGLEILRRMGLNIESYWAAITGL